MHPSTQQLMLRREPEHPPSPPSSASHPFAGAGLLRPTSAPAASSQGKFTFNGMMPTTTPAQLQHKLLQQHQQAAVQSGLASAPSKTGANSNDANELLRLKAQVMSLTDRANQLNANLASTSESVVRGNKALTTERAQFHAKFAGVTRKLEATQAALAEAEAFPVEATKNAKLLNAKILELQEENHQLTQTRATLEATIEARAAEVAALHDASQTAVGTQAALQARCDDLTSKYGALAKQHSVVLSRQEELAEELEHAPGAPHRGRGEGRRRRGAAGGHEGSKRPRPTTWWTRWTPSWRMRAWRQPPGRAMRAGATTSPRTQRTRTLRRGRGRRSDGRRP